MTADDLLEIMDKAIEREGKAEQFYLQAAGKTGDANGKRMFRWLAGEEKKHFLKLSQQREVLSRGGQWQKPPTTQPPITPAEFPPTPEVTGEATATSGELDALQIGIKAETESIALYSKAQATATAPEAKDLFARLVDEEKGHLTLLEEEYQWLKNSRDYFTLHRFTLPPS